MPALKIGQGFDVHAFTDNRPLYLACVLIPHEKGLLGHSDADVMAHALADALLGAAGLGDIGQHFPPQEKQWALIAGEKLLSLTMEKVLFKGYNLANADLTLIGEEPKIAPFKAQMILKISQALKVKPSLINIKATTTEGLGFIGKKEGLAALASVLLAKIK